MYSWESLESELCLFSSRKVIKWAAKTFLQSIILIWDDSECTLGFLQNFSSIWQSDNFQIRQDQGRKFLSKHDKVVTRDAVVSFPESLRDFFVKMFVNILIQFLFWHFICQVEIKFYSRSERQIYNLSFPHQFSSFNFLTYSSGICTSNTLKSEINCDLKT